MALLSRETERDLTRDLLKVVKVYFEGLTKVKPRLLGLMTPKQVEEELDIKFSTLQRWERAGLRRYQPPIEDTRKIFYKTDDILMFLGVEKGGKGVQTD